jgi:hypothetical protein
VARNGKEDNKLVVELAIASPSIGVSARTAETVVPLIPVTNGDLPRIRDLAREQAKVDANKKKNNFGF